MDHREGHWGNRVLDHMQTVFICNQYDLLSSSIASLRAASGSISQSSRNYIGGDNTVRIGHAGLNTSGLIRPHETRTETILCHFRALTTWFCWTIGALTPWFYWGKTMGHEKTICSIKGNIFYSFGSGAYGPETMYFGRPLHFFWSKTQSLTSLWLHLGPSWAKTYAFLYVF